MNSYTIQPGDTLSAIAARFLGDMSRYRDIMAVNPSITDPNRILVGQTIQIPVGNQQISNTAPVAQVVYSGSSTPLPAPSPAQKIQELLKNKWVLAGLGVALVALIYQQSQKRR